jgi:predicted metal-dependent HD superfamily phosphohydrolase
MILSTISHNLRESLTLQPDHKFVGGLFLDADLSVLGWEQADYDKYAWAIWKEYEHYGR